MQERGEKDARFLLHSFCETIHPLWQEFLKFYIHLFFFFLLSSSLYCFSSVSTTFFTPSTTFLLLPTPQEFPTPITNTCFPFFALFTDFSTFVLTFGKESYTLLLIGIMASTIPTFITIL